MSPSRFIAEATYRRGSVLDGIRNVPDGRDVDCDDFAWSLLCHLEGGPRRALRALWIGKAALWRVRSPVNGLIARHVALHWSGWWIDSSNRNWRKEPAPHVPVRRLRMVTLLPLLAWGTSVGKLAMVAMALAWAWQSGWIGFLLALVA
ncbi:hypothetical protein [Tabrizicola flagellatus]|uniref:hypothetical protein n=1 Tax=Tabrizicola flagellatus TaxID=2593021 RepID=UPI0011F153F4|nr:hypothetical protein [Tabrizicola flagellatus]